MPEYEFYFNFFGLKLEGVAAMIGMLMLHLFVAVGAVTVLLTIFDIAQRLWRKKGGDHA